MKATTWNNVPGNLTLEVEKGLEGWWDMGTFKEIPAILSAAIKAAFPMETAEKHAILEFQVEIFFLSSGYYQPAKTNGLPENCYPEEKSDERVLDYIYVSPAEEGSISGYNERGGKRLPADVANQIFDLFTEEIQEVELSPGDWNGDRDD